MQQALAIGIFLGFGLAFVLINLTVSRIIAPRMAQEEKGAIYECGEPTIGESWVQFDLRFYIVALFYLVFDVEVALIYPWAVVFRQYPAEALLVGLPFLSVVVIGYAYEWYSGSLDWVRSSVNTSMQRRAVADLGTLARRDPEALADEAEARAAGA